MTCEPQPAATPTSESTAVERSAHHVELSRRTVLRGVFGGVVALPAAAMLSSCSEDDGASESQSTTTAGGAGSTTATGSSTTTPPQTAPTPAWASGGTDLITVDYPSTSIFATATACTVSLTSALMEGPCYFQSDTGDDISLGTTGLPMQLCLQLIDESCAPLDGYTIEVWHCDVRGIYSGDTSESHDAERFAGAFCTEDDPQALKSSYCRGQATTDAEGRVNFKTIFPGWYSGRTIHIHFAVSDADGTSRIISQWCYVDELAEEIYTTHDRYSGRGSQDTTLASGTDGVFPSDYEPFVLNTRANADGSMLSYGVIQIA